MVGTGERESGSLRIGDAGPTADDPVGSASLTHANPAVDANPIAGSVRAADADPAAAAAVGDDDPAADPNPAAGEHNPAAAEEDALAAGEALRDNGSRPIGVRAHRINGRWCRFAELWVPESMREARVDPGRRGMLVLVDRAVLRRVLQAEISRQIDHFHAQRQDARRNPDVRSRHGNSPPRCRTAFAAAAL